MLRLWNGLALKKKGNIEFPQAKHLGLLKVLGSKTLPKGISGDFKMSKEAFFMIRTAIQMDENA